MTSLVLIRRHDVNQIFYHCCFLLLFRENESRRVRHLQFKTWPNYGVPEAVKPISEFIIHVYNRRKGEFIYNNIKKLPKCKILLLGLKHIFNEILQNLNTKNEAVYHIYINLVMAILIYLCIVVVGQVEAALFLPLFTIIHITWICWRRKYRVLKRKGTRRYLFRKQLIL